MFFGRDYAGLSFHCGLIDALAPVTRERKQKTAT